jgi:hypothetical protein
MVKIREMDLDKNEVTFEDYSKISFSEFQDRLLGFFDSLIAGETLSFSSIERFMKRSSSKNLKQLIEGKKAEGFLEATIGKKLNPMWTKMILLILVLGLVGIVAAVILQKMHII